MCFFFFKQKTAYELRISDWSSDVCSSDLFLECAALVGGDVVGPVAFDLVLRIIRRRVMSVTLVIEVAVVDLHDRAADVAGFRIPGDVIADFQSAGHVWLLHFKRAPIVAAARCPEAESERDRKSTRLNYSH